MPYQTRYQRRGMPVRFPAATQYQARAQQQAAGYAPRSQPAYYRPQQRTIYDILRDIYSRTLSALRVGVAGVGADIGGAVARYYGAPDVEPVRYAAPQAAAPARRGVRYGRGRGRETPADMRSTQVGYTRPPGYSPSFGAPYEMQLYGNSPLMENPWYQFPGPFSQAEQDAMAQRVYWTQPQSWMADPSRFTPAPLMYPPAQGGGGGGGYPQPPGMPRYGGGGGGGGRATDLANWWRNMVYWRI